MEMQAEDYEVLKTLQVLYVEGDPDLREEVAIFLRRRVGNLLVAENGARGWKLFQEQRPQLVITDLLPQLVITDLLMPVMGGMEMVRAIRALDKRVPIVVTTAFEQTQYLLRSIDIGIDKFLGKPINIDRLLVALSLCARRIDAEEQLDLQYQRDN